jgi:hypothetical protein
VTQPLFWTAERRAQLQSPAAISQVENAEKFLTAKQVAILFAARGGIICSTWRYYL